MLSVESPNAIVIIIICLVEELSFSDLTVLRLLLIILLLGYIPLEPIQVCVNVATIITVIPFFIVRFDLLILFLR